MASMELSVESVSQDPLLIGTPIESYDVLLSNNKTQELLFIRISQNCDFELLDIRG